jgi:hypothetical protein
MTAVEVTMTAGLLGLLASQAIRATSREADRSRVTVAQAQVLTAYRLGRSAAQSLGRPASVLVTGDSVVVWSTGPADTAVFARAPGPAAAGVVLIPSSHSATFGPNGMLTGVGNVTHRLERGGIVREVTVSRLGRARTW